MIQRIRVDANVILRFLRRDNPKHSPLAARLFEKASKGQVRLFVSGVTMSEVFYAYTSFYKLTPAQTANNLIPFVQTGVVEFEDTNCLMDALKKVSIEDVDFGDAYLAAEAAPSGDLVASFDKDLKQFKDIKLYDLEDKA